VTEMLVDGLLGLFEEGIVCREVDGAAIHAGFFLDSRDFYARLRSLSDEQRARINMMPVSFTNTLYGDEETKRTARRDARFVNAAMMVTLLGAAVSDQTEDGQVISGVGGQFNFVEQAFALRDARAILTLGATRQGKRGLSSNIRWSYGHATIPRHLRDIVVTEYGIADLRGKSDAETIGALLQVADSRFQGELEEKAKAAGKLHKSWSLPKDARNNTPEALRAWLSQYRDDDLPRFPLGTDFSEIEQYLLPALSDLRRASSSLSAILSLVLRGARGRPAAREAEALERMGLNSAKGFKGRIAKTALLGALRKIA
jgi:acyl-CoA hydrolase